MELKILQAIFNFLNFMYVEVLPACVKVKKTFTVAVKVRRIESPGTRATRYLVVSNGST